MHELSEPLAEQAPPAQRWTEHITWSAMLALGWVLYEVTAQPSYGIAIVCAKFGWQDFATACWLLRWDPHRGRGRSSFYFYVASGLWRITVAAFFVTGCTLWIVALVGERGMAKPKHLIGVGITAAVGITLLAVIPLMGAICAKAYRVKIWIDDTVHQSRRDHVWPPAGLGGNTIRGLLFPALIVPLLVTSLVTIKAFGVWGMLAIVFTEAFTICTLFRGIAASTPAECWGDTSDDLIVENNADADESLLADGPQAL